jgi:hypothetical protein
MAGHYTGSYLDRSNGWRAVATLALQHLRSPEQVCAGQTADGARESLFGANDHYPNVVQPGCMNPFNAGAARIADGRSIARGHIEEWRHILLETEVLVWTQAAIRCSPIFISST